MVATEATVERLALSRVAEVGESIIAAQRSTRKELSPAEVAECRIGASTNTVGGFPALDTARFRALKEARVAEKRKPAEHQEALEAALRANGISYFGVVPLDFWSDVCRKNLIRVRPDSSGRAWISEKIRRQATESADVVMMRVFLGILLGVPLVLVACLGLAGLLGFIPGLLVALCTANYVRAYWRQRSIAKSVARPWPTVIADLFPDGKEPVDEGNEYAARIRWNSPAPDSRIMGKIGILCRDQSMILEIAAEPEAIRFTRPLERIFLDEGPTQEALAKLREADPIICVKYGTVIAIIEQVGDFAFEKAAVNDAIEKSIGISTK